MELEKVVSALSSRTRREIIKVLAEQPMTTMGILEELKGRGFDIKYRESVFKAVERLVDCGLVEKYYERDKGIRYRVMRTTLEIDLLNDTVK